jgi:hypothetical protein
MYAHPRLAGIFEEQITERHERSRRPSARAAPRLPWRPRPARCYTGRECSPCVAATLRRPPARAAARPAGMHGHALESLIDRGQQANDFQLGLRAQHVQRPSAVFAAAPGKYDLFFAHRSRRTRAEWLAARHPSPYGWHALARSPHQVAAAPAQRGLETIALIWPELPALESQRSAYPSCAERSGGTVPPA